MQIIIALNHEHTSHTTHVWLLICLFRLQTCHYNFKVISIDQFSAKITDIFVCLFAYRFKKDHAFDLRQSIRASTNLSTASLTERQERILPLSPAAV